MKAPTMFLLTTTTALLLLLVVWFGWHVSCQANGAETESLPVPGAPSGTTSPGLAPEESPAQKLARHAMVERQIAARGIANAAVLAAMRRVPRHRFVPARMRPYAYEDSALPIGHEQTISQPYIVGFMTEALQLAGDEKVLEIGTGSGYQAAVLGEICKSVYTIEIVEPLARRSKKLLKRLGYDNIHVRAGDGYAGWPEQAPFDAIIVTAAPDHVPPALVEQLKVGGRMILPVGGWWQELIVIEKTARRTTQKKVLPVRFVPMTGEAQRR